MSPVPPAPAARCRPAPARAPLSAPATALLLALALGIAPWLAGCSNDSSVSLPPPAGGAAPVPSLTVVGQPRLSTNFVASLGEQGLGGTQELVVRGIFSVLLLDSLSSRVFVPDVRLNGVPMREETDPAGAPIRYTLDASTDLPGLSLDDTLRFEVRDGGAYTPPYRLDIVPSRPLLPPDSTQISRAMDLVIPWTGVIERFQLNMIDRAGTRLRVNMAFENFDGLDRIVIPAHDLDTLSTGPIFLYCGVDDAEVRTGVGQRLQSAQVTVTRTRTWYLNP